MSSTWVTEEGLALLQVILWAQDAWSKLTSVQRATLQDPSRPARPNTLRSLAGRGFITFSPDGGFLLTDRARAVLRYGPKQAAR